jgi:hypothetical protein
VGRLAFEKVTAQKDEFGNVVQWPARVYLRSSANTALKLYSGYNMSIESAANIYIEPGAMGQTMFAGGVDFSRATVYFGNNTPVAVFG